MPSGVTQLTLNTLETMVFCGCTDGNIYAIDMYAPPLSELQKFTGHKTPVVGLHLSMDESLIVSGCEGGGCIVWDPFTRHQLRSYTHPDSMSGMWVGSLSLANKGKILTCLEPFRRFVEAMDGASVTLDAVTGQGGSSSENGASAAAERQIAELKAANQALYNAVLESVGK
jgi:WD40 repeat protein